MCIFFPDLQDVITYSIIEKEPDTSLFFLNPTSGVLTLKRVWPNGQKNDYQVSLDNVFMILPISQKLLSVYDLMLSRINSFI